MSRVFIDTSAILALLNREDAAHDRARQAFERLRAQQAVLVTTSFVLVETYALIGRRLGLEALRAFRADFTPLLEVKWIERDLCEGGLDLILERGMRDLSLVDAVSFLVIRRERLPHAFAFDRHFEAEGLSLGI